MGSVVGEKTTVAERCLEKKEPFIIISTWWRAHAGRHPLPDGDGEDSAVRARLADASLPFVSVLTDPTTGGVTASIRDAR